MDVSGKAKFQTFAINMKNMGDFNQRPKHSKNRYMSHAHVAYRQGMYARYAILLAINHYDMSCDP